jgi:very-short-patch-repair endonuclease
VKATAYPACPTCGLHHRYGVSHEDWLQWKSRLSESTRNSKGQPGHPHSVEARSKIGAASRGRRHSPQTRAVIAAKGRQRVVSPTTRERISASIASKWRDPEWAKRARRGGRITGLEKTVYGWLNEWGVRFFREVPIIGGTVDIYCPDFLLGVEVDGEYWHPEGNERDRHKDYMRAIAGMQTIRLRGGDIDSGASRITLLEMLRHQLGLLEDLQEIRPVGERNRMIELARAVRDQ